MEVESFIFFMVGVVYGDLDGVGKGFVVSDWLAGERRVYRFRRIL